MANDPFGGVSPTDENVELGTIIKPTLPDGVDIPMNPGDTYVGYSEGNHVITDKDGNFRMVADNVQETQTVMDNGGEFPLPPPGTYDAFLSDIESTYSKAGDAMVKYVFELVDPKWKKSKCWDYVVLLKVPTIYLANMAALGCNAEDLRVSTGLLGRMVSLTVIHDEYQGRKNLKKKAVKKHPQFATYKAWQTAQSGL